MTHEQISILLQLNQRISKARGAILPVVELIERELGDSYLSDETRDFITSDLDEALRLIDDFVRESMDRPTPGEDYP